MLSAVGHPTAVNPDRGLRKAALEHGWPVLQFTRPVSMRARFSVPPTPVVTGAAVGVGAAVVGLAWYARHRALRAGLVAGGRAARSRSAADGGAAAPDASAGHPRPRVRVVHPADVFTVVLAWLAVLAVCVAACLFGQTARTLAPAPPATLRPDAIGLFLSLSGPWLAVARRRRRRSALTGAWLPAAAVGACGVVVASPSPALALAPALSGTGRAQPRSRLSQMARPSSAPCSVARQQCTSQPATPSGVPAAYPASAAA